MASTSRAELLATITQTCDAEASALGTALGDLVIKAAVMGKRIGSFEDLKPLVEHALTSDFTPWLVTKRAAAATYLTDLTDAPGPISYADSPLALTKDAAMTDASPTVAGEAADTFAVSPELPAGLSIAEATGVISGTPTAAQAATTYTITATNDGGVATCEVVITVAAA
ncbi:MAG: hypothetical protein RJA59_421 [Pseudomonadota bacterium]